MVFKEFKEKYEHKSVDHFPSQVKSKPMVSVCVVTYNHVNYIRQCLDGILNQKVDFDFELLLGDDTSTDGTREICVEYAEKYPDKIRLFFHHRENNISIGGKPTGRFNFLYNLYSAQGKYIALCDGDDYWTDPLKLQKQVYFLEVNEEFVLCSHNVLDFYQNTQEFVPNKISVQQNQVVNSEQLIRGEYLQTLSLLFRNILDYSQLIKPKVANGDSLLLSLLGTKGKAMILYSIKPGVYRIHDNGIWTSLKNQKEKKLISKYYLYKALSDIHINNIEVCLFYKKRVKTLCRNLISLIPVTDFNLFLKISILFVSNHSVLKERKIYFKYFNYTSKFIFKKLSIDDNL